ncbi:hypothetical protein O3M35_009467 [Rhynocoris fuscipes]|uniref:SET domain-containing protein n=2 Tax=Rhynocoris fuscipes TaxID=488301 RepID=A0AAW1D8D5_9HEMI
MGRNRKNKVSTQNNDNKTEDGSSNRLEMKTSPILGRYLVAKEDIKAGDIILTVPPLVIGPIQVQGKPLCLSCYKEINDFNLPVRCEGCGWPLCSKMCQNSYQEYGHTEIECSFLRRSENKPGYNFNYHLYDFILPLRVALLKYTSTQKWTEVQKMQSHSKLRKKNKTFWNNDQIMIDCMKKECSVTEFTDQELHTICGYLQVNSFAVEHLGVSGLFPTAFLFAHDCVPNTTHIIDSKFNMTVRATVPISKGEAVTLSYANTLQGTMVRRAFLKETKFFNCICKRCSDATELGTFISAVKCQICKNGYLLPIDPLNKNSIWQCSCGDEKTEEIISLYIKKVSDEVEKVKNKSITEMEAFLKMFSSKFHPNHYLLITIKCLLSQLYGKSNRYLLHELSEELLLRKIELCKDLLQIFDKIEPGLSRIRGITMYELHAPLMIIATSIDKKNSEKYLKSQLKYIKFLLTEANLILSFEDSTSKEGQIGCAAKAALEESKQWEQLFGKL